MAGQSGSEYETGTDLSGARASERDFLALGVALAAIVLFVGTGGTVIPQLVRVWRGLASYPDAVLANALILNIAIILFGWSRYKALSRELAERRISEKEARRLADVDPLTGCYNRRSLMPALAALNEQAQATGRILAVVLVDLDNFKQVNDLNGHTTGDEVLKRTAERIAAILPANALLARLGGDEFACAIPYAPRDAARIESIVTRLIEDVAQPIHVDGLAVEITMSVGIVGSDSADVANEGAVFHADLLHKADIAMYQAKKHGKNRFVWFEASMEAELRFRNDLETGIRNGIRMNQFIPYYEQQIDLDTGELVGFEMLARWKSPELGLVGPEVFIPVSEDIGLIGELSENLMSQAFEDAKLWNPRLTLSVNISPVQLRDPWFAHKLLKKLVQHNFLPSRLEIEITESCLHENLSMVRTMITSLRNQGVQVSLDDFGTGYSSLSQLRALPFDRIKIDRTFVRELEKGGCNDTLVDTIIAMGEGLEIPITAEGIENEAILKALRQMGRLKGQGYHYGLPEPADAVLRRLEKAGLLLNQVQETFGEAAFRSENDGQEPSQTRAG